MEGGAFLEGETALQVDLQLQVDDEEVIFKKTFHTTCLSDGCLGCVKPTKWHALISLN